MDTMKEHSPISQWIVSLAISVICCAILFVIFASYIFDLNEKVAMSNAQLSALQESTNLVLNELKQIRAGVPTTVPVEAAQQNLVVEPQPAETAPAVSDPAMMAPAAPAPAAPAPEAVPAQ